MKITIEFYRIRDADDAHAIVGRETASAANRDEAIEIARQLSRSLSMPQQPDAMTISDATGVTLYSGALNAGAPDTERGMSMNSNNHDDEQERHHVTADVGESGEADRLNPESRAAVNVFLSSYRRGDSAFAISDALEAVRQDHPESTLSNNELTDAIASQAAEASHAADNDKSNSSPGSADMEDKAMSPTDDKVSEDVGAAIASFLGRCQKEARPFAIAEALGAVRQMSPRLQISDEDLVEAIAGAADTAGFDVDCDVDGSPRRIRLGALDEWDNEGGAAARPLQSESQRSLDSDTSGTRRRARETRDRNNLI